MDIVKPRRERVLRDEHPNGDTLEWLAAIRNKQTVIRTTFVSFDDARALMREPSLQRLRRATADRNDPLLRSFANDAQTCDRRKPLIQPYRPDFACTKA